MGASASGPVTTGEPNGRPTRRSRAWGIALCVLFALVAFLSVSGGTGSAVVVLPLGVAGCAIGVSVWAVVRTGRERRRYEERLMAWVGERAAQAERLRIARDLHDLVSHGLGLITVRAAAVRAVATDGHENAEQTCHGEEIRALADIEQVSRETTAELRRMLTVLRGSGSDEPAPLHPADTLNDLAGIVRTARTAGLDVSFDPPDLGHVSPGVQLAICAVVREALHNALRHAGPTRVEVAIAREDRTLLVTVQDEGPRAGWQPRPGAGHGLIGLRERVGTLGGTCETVPDGSGFRLVARIPDEAGS